MQPRQAVLYGGMGGGLAGGALADLATMKDSTKLALDSEQIEKNMGGTGWWGSYREQVMNPGGQMYATAPQGLSVMSMPPGMPYGGAPMYPAPHGAPHGLPMHMPPGGKGPQVG